MQNKRAIVTVGVSGARVFGPYLERFKRTFREFGHADYIKIWHKGWPKLNDGTQSPPHGICHYAFKLYAIWAAWEKGYTSILWMDSSCHAFKSIEPMWERLERDGHVLIEDANALGKWSSDHCLKQFKITRDQAMHIPLMSGTCMGFDLTNKRTEKFLRRMREMATPENFNGTHVSRLAGVPPHPRQGSEGAQMSNDERVWGHRSDEAYSSLIACDLGMVTHAGVEFIGGSGMDVATERACIRSGYDLPPPPAQREPEPRFPNGLINYGDIYDCDP